MAAQRSHMADSVEKLEIFLVGEIISDLTISKILHTEGDRNLTISSDRATGKLRSQVLC